LALLLFAAKYLLPEAFFERVSPAKKLFKKLQAFIIVKKNKTNQYFRNLIQKTYIL